MRASQGWQTVIRWRCLTELVRIYIYIHIYIFLQMSSKRNGQPFPLKTSFVTSPLKVDFYEKIIPHRTNNNSHNDNSTRHGTSTMTLNQISQMYSTAEMLLKKHEHSEDTSRNHETHKTNIQSSNVTMAHTDQPRQTMKTQHATKKIRSAHASQPTNPTAVLPFELSGRNRRE